MNQSLPTRAFREHTDLNQLKRQARELLEAVRGGDAAAITEVKAHYLGADSDTFALHDAQLILARAYGFASWPKLKAYVDGVTAKRLMEAVRAGDSVSVQTMLRARPELVNMGMGGDEHHAIHYAVLFRSPEMTRLLMQHGADARAGIYPHRDATSAFTLASDRGYDEIVAIIRDEEQRLGEAQAGGTAAAAPESIFCTETWESGQAIRMLYADPALARATNPEGCTPLHAAASALDERGISWLLDHGAEPKLLARGRSTPLDLAASGRGWSNSRNRAKFERVAKLLLSRGASLGPVPAVALGDEEWIRARHAEGALAGLASVNVWVNGVVNAGGLLSIAISHDRPGMLALLLDLGLDADEKIRVDGMDEILLTAGYPLFCCVMQRRRQMAEMLLAKGADPNANVYTSGSPLFRAYQNKDREFVGLLEQHGGLLDAVSAGFACQTGAASQLLADEAAGRLRPGAVLPGNTVSEDLLWTACGGGDPEIVRMALERIDWPRQDSRWLGSLWQAFTCGGGLKRGLACFRLVLDRADPNQGDSGHTILHTVMAQGEKQHVPHAEMLLDRGARFDIRDELLRSTALGWACRWGRIHFVKLLLERGADPIESDAEPWATPMAWAQKMKHDKVVAMLQAHGGQP